MRDPLDNPQKWTPDYAFRHLTDTFNRAFREFPDLLEPYVNMLADDNPDRLTRIMRAGLANTINQRWPAANSLKPHGNAASSQAAQSP